jgi:hypothetical protein
MMQNIEAKVDGDKLTIIVDLSKSLGPSKSGKTIILATSGGNQPIAPGVMLGINVYKKH